MKFNKTEIRDLAKYGYDVKKIEEPPRDAFDLDRIIILPSGRKELHDSGYPFIRIIGVRLNKLYDMGDCHDHIQIDAPVSMDSIGKNIMHMWKLGEKRGFKVMKGYIPVSTFWIYKDGEIW